MMEMKGYDTHSPVPVRLDTFVTAFLDERVLEELDVVPVPWEEETSVVDLSLALTEREDWQRRG